jgi:hypothetical protein
MKDFGKHKSIQFQDKYIDAAMSHFEGLVGDDKADERKKMAEAFVALKKGGQLHFRNVNRFSTLQISGRGGSRDALAQAQSDLAHLPLTKSPTELRREILLTQRVRSGLSVSL